MMARWRSRKAHSHATAYLTQNHTRAPTNPLPQVRRPEPTLSRRSFATCRRLTSQPGQSTADSILRVARISREDRFGAFAARALSADSPRQGIMVVGRLPGHGGSARRFAMSSDTPDGAVGRECGRHGAIAQRDPEPRFRHEERRHQRHVLLFRRDKLAVLRLILAECPVVIRRA